MPEYLENPRRAPRAPVRCPTRVVTAWGRFDAETADVGPRGCQLVSPRPVRRGEPVHLLISNPNRATKLEQLELNAHVAWASACAPWRLGAVFAPAGQRGDRWYAGLIASFPDLEAYRRLPERIPMDAIIYLGRPPSAVIDFTLDECELLRAIASGARIDDLRARFHHGWPGALRALFSLLARCHVTSSRRAAVDPALWSRILGVPSHEAPAVSGALAESPPSAAGAPGVPSPSPRPPLGPGTPPRTTPSGLTPMPVLRSPPRVARAEARSVDRGILDHCGPRRTPIPDFVGAGVGWRSPPKPRSSQADEDYRRALSELQAGRNSNALALLRRALSLAPGDPEIAKKLGDTAFATR